MDTLRDKLDRIHEVVVDALLAELQAEQEVDSEDRDAVADARNVARAARRDALQLLKQNNISAAAMPETPLVEMARMAGKLNFQVLEQKRRPTLPMDRLKAVEELQERD